MSDATLILGKIGSLSQDLDNIRPELWLKPATDGQGNEIPGGYILCVSDLGNGAKLDAVIALLTDIKGLLEQNNQQNSQKISLLSAGSGGLV